MPFTITPAGAQPAQPATDPQAATAPAINSAPEPAKAESQANPGEPAKDATLDPRFAELSRKESVVRKTASELHAQRQQFAKERQEFEAQTADPLKFLASKGYGADKLLELLIASGAQPPAAQPAPASENPEIKALKDEIAALKKGQVEQVDKQYTEALKQIERQATSQVDKFPTIKARGAVSEVVELIKKQHAANGEIIPTDEAMRLVEEALIEEGLAWANLEPIKAKLQPKPAEQPAPQSPGSPAPAKRPGMPARIVSSSPKNITNSIVRTKPAVSARDRAIAAGNGVDPNSL